MADIFDLEAFKRKKVGQFEDPLFQKQIDRMDKVQLLEEMVKFQDARSKAKDSTTTFWIVRGIILFTALSQKCETDDMRTLAGSYKRHLEHELNIQKGLKK